MKRRITLLTATALVATTLAALPAAAGADPLCFGRPATVLGLVGTDGPDVIIGTPGDDVIDGGNGKDRICGLGGNDTIDGGIGNDRIDGGEGRDRLLGGAGSDVIVGGDGNDVILGFRGNDRLNGDAGHDRIIGADGRDLIDGGSGNDVIFGGRGPDDVDGGEGHDRISGGNGDDDLHGNDGTDRVAGQRGTDVVDGGTNPFGPGDMCDGETKTNCEAAFVPCVIGAPPAPLVQGFYAKYCEVFGLDILGSASIDDEAMLSMATILRAMLSSRPDLTAEIDDMTSDDGLGHRFGIMGRTEVTTDLPEYMTLPLLFPGTDWDTRGRGFGATASNPMTSGSEENLLCLPWGTIEPWGDPPYGDPYFGESVFVHELAHAVHLYGLGDPLYGDGGIDPTFDGRLQTAYANAVAAELWDGLYAETNHREYFAVGVTAYFNSAAWYNPATNRSQLRTHDRMLYDLIDEVFGGVRWQPDCVTGWGVNSADAKTGLHPLPGRPDDLVESGAAGLPSQDVARTLR